MGGEIEAFDLRRLFIGDASPWFLAEVVFRTAFMFLFTLLLIRLTGKRGLGELSPFELLMVVALGSAVGDPMFYADVPLLHAMAVITVIVLLQRGVASLVDKSERAERFIESETTALVANGVIDVNALRREHFARDELFMLLRESGVEQLGQVKRAFLEPSGRISVWLFPPGDVRPGLPLVPANDPECTEPLPAESLSDTGAELACCTCGGLAKPLIGTTLGGCAVCNSDAGWVATTKEVHAASSTRTNPINRIRRGFFNR